MNNPAIKLSRPLIFATASEARRKLLSDLGIDFIIDSVSIDENPEPHEIVSDYVRRLASEKARAVVPPTLDSVIVTVDTAIGLDGRIIGKPSDERHARQILKDLSGREHEVLSAIAIRNMASESIDVETTHTLVEMTNLTDAMIDWYISTGEWKNRAGAYAIQGKGMSLVQAVHGCLTNVIGMSVPSLLRMLKAICGS